MLEGRIFGVILKHIERVEILVKLSTPEIRSDSGVARCS